MGFGGGGDYPTPPAPVAPPPPPPQLSASAVAGTKADLRATAATNAGMGFDNTVLTGPQGIITMPDTTKNKLFGAGVI